MKNRSFRRTLAAALSGTTAMALLAGCGGSTAATTSADTAAEESADAEAEESADAAAGENTDAAVEESADAAEGTTTAAEDDGTYHMAYVSTVRDEYLGLLEEEVVNAAKEQGVDMEVLFAENDAMKMIDCVEAAKNAGKDAVLINLYASEEAQACIDAAGDDMKVIFVNREPDSFDVLNENVVFVGSDEHTSGRFQGEYLAEYFKEQGKTDVSYVLLRGTEGLVHTDLRSDGAIQAMKDAGLNVTEAAVVEGDYDRNTAKNQMDVVLPGLECDCIIANNDAMALGAILAMKDAGIDPASIPVVGIDATEDGKEAIRNGEMAMTVFQSAKGQAVSSVQAAINVLEGKALEEGTDCVKAKSSPYVIFYPFIPVTAENVDEIAKN